MYMFYFFHLRVPFNFVWNDKILNEKKKQSGMFKNHLKSIDLLMNYDGLTSFVQSIHLHKDLIDWQTGAIAV